MQKEKITCENCNGACCQGLLMAYADESAVELLELRGLRCFQARAHDHGYEVFSPPCRFLNPEGKCSVYEMRPEGCKLYPVGGPSCRQMRALWYPFKD